VAERVDRYDLLAPLGSGSFGVVHRARHVHTGQIVALKIARGSADPDAAARILSEGRAAASLRHPNVVGVLDGGVTPSGDAFVVMELLDGETLAQHLARSGPFDAAHAVAIIAQVLDGLAAAHAKGIVHRDLKPSNVFLCKEGAKVIDFGISKLRRADVTGGGALTLPGVALGTPGYMAPEQLGDARSVDARADVYSVGATLFEMLSRKKPIDPSSFEQWMNKLTTEPAPPLASVAPQVSLALASVVDRALARDRDARWPSARAMRDALLAATAETIRDAAYASTFAAVGGVAPTLDMSQPARALVAQIASAPPVHVVSAPPPVHVARPAKRPTSPAWFFALAGLLLALLSLVAVAAFLAGRSR
jgi:serine/threonine-protein kinase